ncbi:RHS repeat-associated core domain-containing protein [Sporosarcina sp. ITBMC105]
MPLTMTQNGQTYYYIVNGSKEIVALTDSSGTTVASYMYDAWGNILQQSGPMAEENPLRYKGYRYDTEVNFYYLVARYYEPTTGVFLSRDPQSGSVTSPISQNSYAYADNNPVMFADHDGENPLLIINLSLADYDGYKVYSVGGSKKKLLRQWEWGCFQPENLKVLGRLLGLLLRVKLKLLMI